MKKKLFFGFLLILIFIPTLMYLAWNITPNTKLVVAIIDKTVLTKDGQEHLSLHWVLNHEKYTKTSEKAYKTDHDYFGFFPEKEEEYKLKGLERFSDSKLKQLSVDADLVYFTDTYGIYNNEWFHNGDEEEPSGMLYGGLSDNDLELLELMQENNKLIITEFNTIGSPTSVFNRKKFEKIFGITWSGWTARYFASLNFRENKSIPDWVIRNYNKSSGKVWDFKNSGIILVNDRDEIVVLETGTHLNTGMPFIKTLEENQTKYNLPDSIKYPFWFDILRIDTKANESISSFELDYTSEGKKSLQQHNIPLTFPAITKAKNNRFFYFSGDFADNPVEMTSSYFKWIEYLKSFFYDERHEMERASFFWKFYRPLLTNILEDYEDSLQEPEE